MPNRRQFFKTVAGAAVSLNAGERILRAQAPPSRRQVSVAGKRVKVIDVHAHWDMPLGDVVKGTPYEKDRATGPGLDDRIAAMDKLGVDVEAVSVNDFWWWEIKDQGLARATQRGAHDRMERAELAFHERVSRAFARFATPEWQRAHPECGPIELIDAGGSESEVFDRVVIALHAHWPETFPSLSTAE